MSLIVETGGCQRGRALPLIWRVIEHESASISFADYQEMLRQAQARLPESVTVVLLADRRFIHTKLMTMLTTKLGWHYRIRIKSSNWIWKGNWCQPQNFYLSYGKAVCLHNVQIHKADATPRRRKAQDKGLVRMYAHQAGEFYGKVHVIIGRNSFRIAWDWVKAALLNGWNLLCSVSFSSHCDPTPAIASLKQHQQQLYQLEFQVHAHSYNIS